jgi:ubiquinone/menaquinone biosynthesis C-methylase UbiE
MDTGEYSMAVGDLGAARLRLADEVYGPGTRQLLERAGLREGLRVVDLGCGTATVARWMARRVGPSGRVVGVDASADQLAVARRAAAAEGHANLELVEGSVYATGLPRASFDIACCRFLLMHIPRPVEVLCEMRALLRPGGVLVCEEISVDSSFCEPPSPEQGRLQALSTELGARLGCDFNVARRLYHLLLDAGLPAPEIAQHQPVFVRGEAKRVEELSFREVAPRMAAVGLSSRAEIDALIERVWRLTADETVVYSLSRMVQVWARA